MSPSENEDDAKKTGLRPEPLCLFCFPEESTFSVKKTYVDTFPKREPDIQFKSVNRPVRWFSQKVEEIRNKQKEEFWLRKRTEARIRRRRMKEPIRNLKAYLLSSVPVSWVSKKTTADQRHENVSQKSNLPSLIEVLEIVKDAWPSPSSRKKALSRQDDQKSSHLQCQTPKLKMKDRKANLQILPQLLNRRFSMPEELMRKFSVSKERTSEESETNKTAVEISPSSSSIETTETVRKVTEKKAESDTKPPPDTMDVCQQTSDPEQPKETEHFRRVTQNDYYNQGKQIIKIKVEKGCTCQREDPTSTTGSVKEETDDSGTSDSIPSSSPTQLPKRESSSGNLSSESDYLRCTCAELTSTSTDLFRSGKSTLSQTISDKSMSTQDSTVSINSVSTRGSTDGDNSDSTTPEKRRSAKESTTSTDYSPRTPRNIKTRRCYHGHKKTCPRYVEVKHSKCRRQCPLHSEDQCKNTVNVATNTDNVIAQETKNEVDLSEKSQSQAKRQTEQSERYKWTKLSQEELYMMQQLRHRKFIENQKRLAHPPQSTPNEDSISVYGTGSTYKKTENIDEPIMIPRYSALPRTLSMLVNTSSPDTSHNSDSDNQSLADSLEDQPTTHIHKLYFDTKKESKPVRGDSSFIQDNKPKPRQPRGRAFFVSIKDPYGEDEMLENIEKIPQPPEKIKNQIFERHLNLCSKHRHLHEDKAKGGEATIKKRKGKSRQEDLQTKKKEGKQTDGRGEKTKHNCENNSKGEASKKDKSRSKIPVFVSSRSTSSSPEEEPKEKPPRPKGRLRREKQPEDLKDTPKPDLEITQILEITQTGPEISLQKPQAVIHPSVDHKSDLSIPPLVSTLRIPPFRQLNKQLILPVRKSPIGKFRQRFEVIPEEKSSSLSSAEEKNSREILPKFADASTSPGPSEKVQFQNYNVNEVPNVIVAKLTNKQLENLPCVSSDGQKIILLSKSQNSTKGRDALIAMNQEDFNRLAKGWLNFYKLNDYLDNSDNEGKKPKQTEETKTTKEAKCLNDAKLKEPELEEPVRFHSSCTILKEKSMPLDSGKNPKMQTSLPELELPGESSREVYDGSLLKKAQHRDEESDSDSTDYMEPPSPRVPPLPIKDIPSDATLSSTDSDLDEPKPQITTQSLKYLQVKRRTTTNKTRLRKDILDTSRFGKKKNPGWSVTVAGTVELSRSAPDLEMRLSFPAKTGPPIVSQSDSGFAEDSNYSRFSKSFQELSLNTARKDQAVPPGNTKQQWMVTVKNPKKGAQEQTKQCPNARLPDLDCDRNAKKEFKDVQLEINLKRIVERKIWPKVQEVIREEFLTGSGRAFLEMDDGDDDSGLSVIGSSVSLERKQKPRTMTERDVTRRCTSRAGAKQ